VGGAVENNLTGLVNLVCPNCPAIDCEEGERSGKKYGGKKSVGEEGEVLLNVQQKLIGQRHDVESKRSFGSKRGGLFLRGEWRACTGARYISWIGETS